MNYDFTFTELIEKRGLDVSKTKMVRHDQSGGQAWLAGIEEFDIFASEQNASPNPYYKAQFVCQFAPLKLPHGVYGGLFIGVHEILSWEKRREEPILDFKLHRLDEFQDLVGRVIVRWGETSSSTRSWYQWPYKQPKPIVELRSEDLEQPFPGFGGLVIQSENLASLPLTWRSALSSTKGIYLLVAQDGKQYVGSASGTCGFLGRWLGYDDGDNNNRGLKNLPDKNYTMSILEVVSSTMSNSEIVARENLWKAKLGSKVHGHNRN